MESPITRNDRIRRGELQQVFRTDSIFHDDPEYLVVDQTPDRSILFLTCMPKEETLLRIAVDFDSEDDSAPRRIERTAAILQAAKDMRRSLESLTPGGAFILSHASNGGDRNQDSFSKLTQLVGAIRAAERDAQAERRRNEQESASN